MECKRQRSVRGEFSKIFMRLLHSQFHKICVGGTQSTYKAIGNTKVLAEAYMLEQVGYPSSWEAVILIINVSPSGSKSDGVSGKQVKSA